MESSQLNAGRPPRTGAVKTPLIRDRALGCVLGGAAGDALGAPVEFMRLDEIKKIIGPEGITGYWDRSPNPDAFTDDTQMTLWTIEGLIRTRQRWHVSDYNWWSPITTVGNAYLRWLHTQGEKLRTERADFDEELLLTGWLLTARELYGKRAPGSTCLSSLRTETAGAIEAPLNDSKGCGGVMRVAPAGFVPFDGYAFELGANLAAITHGHPSGYLSGGALAHIIAYLKDGGDLRDAVESALKALSEHDGHDEVTSAMTRALDLADRGNPTPSSVESLGLGWVAEEALAIAVYCSLVATDFRHGVLLAVNHSGDSDSTGSIAGQILGTIHGVDGIPVEWIDDLEAGSLIADLTNDFVDAFYEEKVFNDDLYPGW